jgi:predicted RNA-binding Zn-ribbon protein involved in translation (DUF1610 family)
MIAYTCDNCGTYILPGAEVVKENGKYLCYKCEAEVKGVTK